MQPFLHTAGLIISCACGQFEASQKQGKLIRQTARKNAVPTEIANQTLFAPPSLFKNPWQITICDNLSQFFWTATYLSGNIAPPDEAEAI